MLTLKRKMPKTKSLKNEVLTGGAYDMLDYIPTEYVHCCVTSPPYWNLRDYDNSNDLGHEESPQTYVTSLCDIFEKVHRVLRSDGTLWLNIGDSYSDKNLVGIPWKVAERLKEMGFVLRSDIIWHKTNAMPDTTKDRPGVSHEHIFMFSKSRHYFYDYYAVSKNKNIRDVWSVPTSGSSKQHYASYPEKLIAPCIMAGTSEHGVCKSCGAPFVRLYDYSDEYAKIQGKGYVEKNYRQRLEETYRTEGKRGIQPLPSVETMYVTVGWEATCECWNQHEEREAATVLDPFMGSGTTARVAKKLGRNYTGIEINPDYLGVIQETTSQEEIFTWQ